MNRSALAALGVLWVTLFGARASAANPEAQPVEAPADLDGLRAELARQSRALELINAELDAQRESARADWKLRFSGYFQVDWVIHNQASQDEVDFSSHAPLNQDRFTLRRGHLRSELERGLLSGALELDANSTNGPELRPTEATISLRWPEPEDSRLPSLSASVGLMKIPFGFEVPERDAERPFLERSVVMRALFPGESDLGARIRARYRFLELGVALMNGHPLGDRIFPALAPSRTKELVGRIGTHAEVVPGVKFELGVSADTGQGFHTGTQTTKDELVWRDDNGDGIVQATEVQVIPGSSATPSRKFERFALGGDARLLLSFLKDFEFSARAEIARGKNLDRGLELADPIGAGRDLRELGYYLGVTQELTRWVLVGVRYDRYDPDQDANEQRAVRVVAVDRSYDTLALLAMLRYEGARFALEYDRNRNALGREPSGAPTSLASDTLTARAQLRF